MNETVEGSEVTAAFTECYEALIVATLSPNKLGAAKAVWAHTVETLQRVEGIGDVERIHECLHQTILDTLDGDTAGLASRGTCSREIQHLLMQFPRFYEHRWGNAP